MGNIFSSTGGILRHFNIISTELEDNNFQIGNKQSVNLSLRAINYFFNITQEESVALTVITTLNLLNDNLVSICDIASFYACNPYRVYDFFEQFESLCKKKLIEYIEKETSSDVRKGYVLSKSAKNSIIHNDKSLLIDKHGNFSVKMGKVVLPQKIQSKELFYPNETRKEIDNIKNYLSEEKFSGIQKRLEKVGYEKNVCIMFYGESGTGKTESVYQIAKETNRPVFHMEGGKIISKWIGELENNLTTIFEDYEDVYNTCVDENIPVPILLFNEADTLFGKRMDVETTHDSYLNRTQSLLLDLIDNFHGIMIITTNFPDFLDLAYERRFLFKIGFKKPDISIQEKIWKSKLNYLSKESIKSIASKYDFSGSQIQNIARKVIMNEVLEGKKSTENEILEYCKNEKLNNEKNNKVGFSFE